MSRTTLHNRKRAAAALEQATSQLTGNQFEATIRTCEAALALPTLHNFQRAELLNCLGTAHMMLKNYSAAYDAFSATLKILPGDPYLWYNRGISSHFTMRSGQAHHDFQQAAALEGSGDMAASYTQAVQQSGQVVQRHLALRGPGFTLEQLIEQEELFNQAVTQMDAEQWDSAAQTLRRVIEMGDGPPQPWTNLGTCLLVQQRHDEAAAAYRRALELDPANENARYHLDMLQSYSSE
jgi:Flp pilus assembly protein TadD